ncbi:MAG: inner membrane CreD family protein, partial [Hyphomonadaceae bacterium]
FMQETNPYQSVERALKYAAMFIGFVFLAYFLFEITSQARAHPAQYVLVGLAQAIFYLLLLALAERLGFDPAFLIAATMTVLLTSGYAMSVFGSRAYGLRALVVLTGIYGLVYVLMRAEGQALLAGALASFTAIALTMWMTRDIDWYGMKKPD